MVYSLAAMLVEKSRKLNRSVDHGISAHWRLLSNHDWHLKYFQIVFFSCEKTVCIEASCQCALMPWSTDRFSFRDFSTSIAASEYTIHYSSTYCSIMTAQSREHRAQSTEHSSWERELVGCWIRNRWMFIMADLNLELSAEENIRL